MLLIGVGFGLGIGGGFGCGGLLPCPGVGDGLLALTGLLLNLLLSGCGGSLTVSLNLLLTQDLLLLELLLLLEKLLLLLLLYCLSDDTQNAADNGSAIRVAIRRLGLPMGCPRQK
jgi:hypothetical protein